MRVYIPHVDTDADKLSGKSLFCHRLGNAMREKGIDVSEDAGRSVDISLDIIALQRKRAKKHIVRINGLCHDIKRSWKAKNRGMQRNNKQADGIVFQSVHSLKLFENFVAPPSCPHKVILNGADPTFYEGIKRVKLPHVVFLAFARWRPHKRLKTIMDAFLKAHIPDSKLLIAGDISKSGMKKTTFDDYTKTYNIQYLGVLKQKELAGYIKAAAAVIHLCWFDSCPNGVVESLVAGTPVITNNVGGTWELVSKTEGGFVLPLDQRYDYKPVDLYHPPKVKLHMIVEALWKCYEQPIKVPYPQRLFISKVAEQYISFFEEVLA